MYAIKAPRRRQRLRFMSYIMFRHAPRFRCSRARATVGITARAIKKFFVSSVSIFTNQSTSAYYIMYIYIYILLYNVYNIKCRRNDDKIFRGTYIQNDYNISSRVFVIGFLKLYYPRILWPRAPVENLLGRRHSKIKRRNILNKNCEEL